MDVAHTFSGDLQAAANGDLLAVDSVSHSQQRVLRRLLTNPTDYIWNPEYGAGLPGFIGSVIDERELSALIRAQMFKERSVVQSPAPVIASSPLSNGIAVDVSYTETDSNEPTTLTFEVS